MFVALFGPGTHQWSDTFSWMKFHFSFGKPKNLHPLTPQQTCRRDVLCKFVKWNERTGLIRRNATSTTEQSRTEDIHENHNKLKTKWIWFIHKKISGESHRFIQQTKIAFYEFHFVRVRSFACTETASTDMMKLERSSWVHRVGRCREQHSSFTLSTHDALGTLKETFPQVTRLSSLVGPVRYLDKRSHSPHQSSRTYIRLQ